LEFFGQTSQVSPVKGADIFSTGVHRDTTIGSVVGRVTVVKAVGDHKIDVGVTPGEITVIGAQAFLDKRSLVVNRPGAEALALGLYRRGLGTRSCSC
jgi:hypothetical protein